MYYCMIYARSMWLCKIDLVVRVFNTILSSIPLRIKDHQFDTPIVDIKFHDRSRNVISSCKKIIRIWNKDSGNNYCYIEQNADISDVCVVPDSGLLFVANASSKMGVYYIPDLGKAPEWASFLDNLTVLLVDCERKRLRT